MDEILIPINKVVFCFWTGDNPMSDKRKRAYDAMLAKIGVPVDLVTPDKIAEVYPIHPAYQYLSNVHKSDYLRCYYMRFHGGGYSDVKAPMGSWAGAFERLENNPDMWGLGYQELNPSGVTPVGGAMETMLKRNYKLLLGNGCYIFRRSTPFVKEWFELLTKEMDKYADDLKKNPGNVWGDNKGYPIAWTGILGNIFHPLCLKHNTKLIRDNRVLFDYRKAYR
jgi:hypothetical protein